MFKVYIENLEFETIIGILDFERKAPQKVIVNACIGYKKSQDIFLDYALVCNLIKEDMINKQYLLIEDALDSVGALLKDKFNVIEFIKLKISKPNIISNVQVSVEKEVSFRDTLK